MIGHVHLVRPNVDNLCDEAIYDDFYDEVSVAIAAQAVDVKLDEEMPRANELARKITNDEVRGIIVRIDINPMIEIHLMINREVDSEVLRFMRWLRAAILNCRILALVEYRDELVSNGRQLKWSDYRAACEWLRAAVILCITKPPKDAEAAQRLQVEFGLDAFMRTDEEVAKAYCGESKAPCERRPVTVHPGPDGKPAALHPLQDETLFFVRRARQTVPRWGRVVVDLFGVGKPDDDALHAFVLNGYNWQALSTSFDKLRKLHGDDALGTVVKDHVPFLLAVRHKGGSPPTPDAVQKALWPDLDLSVRVELLDPPAPTLDEDTGYYVVRVTDVEPADSDTASRVLGIAVASQ